MVTKRYLMLTVIGLCLIWLPSVYANDTVSQVVKGLTEFAPSSPEFQKATELAKTLSEDQATEAAQKIKDKVIGDAVDSARTVLNLYQIGVKAGKAPFLKIIGSRLANALKKALGGLGDVFKDPETNSGKLFINSALENLGVSDVNKRMDIIEKIEDLARDERLKQENAGKTAKSRSNKSLTFEATTGILSFKDTSIVSVLNPNGGIDISDTIVGAEVTIPAFQFDGINPEGAPVFINISGSPLTISKGTDVFLETLVQSLIWDGEKLFGYGANLVLSGAPLGSPFEGGLPDLNSAFIDDMNARLFPLDFKFYWAISIIPDVDLLNLTKNLTQNGTTGFTNGEGLTQTVPEPSTLLLLGAGLARLAMLKKKMMRARD